MPPSKKLSNVCQLYVILWSKFCWTRISHLFFSKITQFLKNRSYIIWAGDVIPKIRGIWAVEKSLIWAQRHFLRRLVQNSSACSTFHKQKNIIISTVDKSREKVWRHQKIRNYSNTQRHLFFRMSNWNSNNFFLRPLWLFWLMSYIFSEPSNKNGYLNSKLMLRWLCPFKGNSPP